MGLGQKMIEDKYCLTSYNKTTFYAMKSFLKKAPHRKWTWASPDGVTKNQIDLIISNMKNIVQDVTVLNKFSIGSDHRAVRAKIVINTRKERLKLIRKTVSRKSLTTQSADQYAKLLNSRLSPMLTNEENINMKRQTNK